jgi:hypothetical protein
MKGGHSLPLTDMAAGPRSTINGDLTVESLNWDFIDSATRTQKGLELQLESGKSWMLEGTLVLLQSEMDKASHAVSI